jgi:hypothetical protein
VPDTVLKALPTFSCFPPYNLRREVMSFTPHFEGKKASEKQIKDSEGHLFLKSLLVMIE